MYSQKNNLPPFESVISNPSKIFNYGFGLLMVFSLLLVIGILIMLLFMIPEETDLIFVCVLLVPAIILQVVYLKRTRKHTTTIIDERGIHYVNKFNNTTEKSILWNDFRKINQFNGILKEVNSSSDADLLKYDAFAKMVGSGKYSHEMFFCFFSTNDKVEVQKEKFAGNHIFSMIYKNKLELVRGILLGLAHFRPDLKVHPDAFIMFYINPDSFVVEYGKRRDDIKTAIFIVFFITIIAVFIILFALS